MIKEEEVKEASRPRGVETLETTSCDFTSVFLSTSSNWYKHCEQISIPYAWNLHISSRTLNACLTSWRTVVQVLLIKDRASNLNPILNCWDLIAFIGRSKYHQTPRQWFESAEIQYFLKCAFVILMFVNIIAFLKHYFTRNWNRCINAKMKIFFLIICSTKCYWFMDFILGIDILIGVFTKLLGFRSLYLIVNHTILIYNLFLN